MAFWDDVANVAGAVASGGATLITDAVGNPAASVGAALGASAGAVGGGLGVAAGAIGGQQAVQGLQGNSGGGAAANLVADVKNPPKPPDPVAPPSPPTLGDQTQAAEEKTTSQYSPFESDDIIAGAGGLMSSPRVSRNVLLGS